MAWKSQRTRTLDLALLQAEAAQQQVQGMRTELTCLHRELSELHGELARRDVELIGALTSISTVTDQLRMQNEQDRAHHERLDRAIELLTMVITSPPALERAGRAEVADSALSAPSGATVIGGSIDPSLLDVTEVEVPVIDLSAEPSDDAVISGRSVRFR